MQPQECSSKKGWNWQVDAPEASNFSNFQDPAQEKELLADDGHAGILCMRALLNLSGIEAAQVGSCTDMCIYLARNCVVLVNSE